MKHHMIMAALIVLLCVTPARGMAVEGLDELYQQAEEYGVTPEDDLELGLGKLVARVPEVCARRLCARALRCCFRRDW